MRDLGRWRWTVPGSLFVLFVLAIYSTPLASRRNFAGRDLLVYSLPIEKAVHQAYARGRLPIWIPEISGGRPLAANPVVGAFYPLRPLLAMFPFPVAMRLFPVFHWAAAGLGILLLLRSLGSSQAAAWIGAVTYAFSGVAVSEVFYPSYQPGMTLLPWVIWAVHRRTGLRASRLLVLAILFGLLMLAGDMFTILLSILAGLLWILLERAAPERSRDFLFFGGAFLLGALLAAPQMVAALLWAPETRRAVTGMPLGHSVSFSIAPLRFLELVVPFPFGSTWAPDDAPVWGTRALQSRTIGYFTTLYAGAFSLVALVASRRARTPGSRFALVFFLSGLVLSVVPGFLPASWASVRSPLPLRYPEKFAVALVLALAILAGLAFDRFRESRVLPRWPLALAGLIAAVAAAAAVFPGRAGAIAVAIAGQPGLAIPEAAADPAAAAAAQLPPALAEAGLLWLVTCVALDFLRRPGSSRVWVSVVLLSLVPVAANRRIARTVPTERISAPSAFGRFLDRADPARAYRTLGEPYYLGISETGMRQWSTRPHEDMETWTLYQHALMGRGTVFNLDFDLGDLARLDSLRRISSLAVRQPTGNFFGSLALRWGIRFRDQRSVPGYRAFRENSVHAWDELAGAFPDMRLAESWTETPGPVEAARAILGLERGEVVIESGRAARGRARAGTIRVIEREPGGFVLETDSPDATWLFVLRGFWPHRTINVDREPVDAVPAQVAFSAVPVPPGKHEVAWRELLPGGNVSRWGPVLFVLLAAALLARERRGKTA